MKPLTEELIRKHLGDLEISQEGDKWHFCNAATGLQGTFANGDMECHADDPAVEKDFEYRLFKLGWEVHAEEENQDWGDWAYVVWRFREKWGLKDFWSPAIALSRGEKGISRERILWTLEDHGLKAVRRGLLGGFIATMESGREIRITQSRVDYGGLRLRKGETEEEIGAQRYVLTKMCSEAWDGVTFPETELKGQELLNTAREIEEAGIKVKDPRVLALRYFGPDATSKSTSSGLIIKRPNGDGMLCCMSGSLACLTRIYGANPETYAQALRLLHCLSDEVIVRGEKSLCATAVAHGEMLGIKVIPELERSEKAEGLIGAAVMWTIALCLALAQDWPSWWVMGIDLLAAYVVTVAGAIGTSIIFADPLRKGRRKRGEVFLNTFPVPQASIDRKASLDQLREKGML